MGQFIDIPGKGIIEFPDNMTHEQIVSAIQKNYPELRPTPGRADTALKYSAGSGVANLLDLPGRTVTAAANLATMAGGYMGSKLGILKPDQLPDTIPPDQLDVFNPMFRKAGIIDDKYAPNDTAGRIVDFTTQAITGGGMNPAAVARSASRGLIKPIARDIVAASASGAGAGVGNEVASQVNTGNETVDTLARVGGTLIGGAVPGGAAAARGTAGDRAAAAIRGISPEQMRQADQRARVAAALDNPITGFEAIQSVTGLNPKMQTIQRVTEQSDAAANGLTQVMQKRPERNSIMFNKAVDQLSPAEAYPDVLAGELRNAADGAVRKVKKFRTEATSPYYKAQQDIDAEAMQVPKKISDVNAQLVKMLRSKDEATQTYGKLKALENEQVQGANNYYPVPGYPKFPPRYTNQADRVPEYSAAADDALAIARSKDAEIASLTQQAEQLQSHPSLQKVPATQAKIQGLLDEIDNHIALVGEGSTEAQILKAFRGDLAPTDGPLAYPSQLESAYKANRNKLDLPPTANDIQKTTAGVLAPYVKRLDSFIQEASPNITEGRNVYKQLTNEVVAPVEASQVGKLSRSDDFGTLSQTFLPRKPKDVNEAVVERTVGSLSEQDPDIVRRFLAQALRSDFNEANQGTNPMGGAQFGKLVADNPQQRANLIAALRKSGAPAAPFEDALDVFHAQGYKPPVNSATTANATEQNLMSGKRIADVMMGRVRPAVDSWRNGWATTGMADALAAGPDSVRRIEELARANGVHDPMKQQMLINMLLSKEAVSHEN